MYQTVGPSVLALDLSLACHKMPLDCGYIVLIVVLVSHAARSRLPSLPRFGADDHDYTYKEAPNLRFRQAKENNGVL